jgi:Ca2+-binding RTX toxin-like protein
MPRAHRRAFRPLLECLEDRRVPAAPGISFKDGVVTVRGTPFDDKVVCSQRGDRIKVELTGSVTQVKRLAEVDEIVFKGFGGDDRAVNNTDVSMTALGGAGSDVLAGGDGDDLLRGGPGDDLLLGGDGDDELDGGPGNDRLFGGEGDDVLAGGPGANILSGDGGDNLLISISPRDRLSGGSEDAEDTAEDLFEPTTEAEAGTAAPPLIFKLPPSLFSIQLSGNELILRGTSGNDNGQVRVENDLLVATMNGQTKNFNPAAVGKVTFYGYAGDDGFTNQTSIPATAYGGDGNDVLKGGGDRDSLFGGAGDDVVQGMGANDVVSGQEGNDTLDGGLGHDWVFGGDGSDKLYGGTGDDRLYGGAGTDYLSGGTGDDWLFGGPGFDLLFGGTGTNQLFPD